MFSWLRRDPTQNATLSELRRHVAEAQSDITLLYDQLERINNRLKRRDSRAAHQPNDDSADAVTAGNGAHVVEAPPENGQSSDQLTGSPSSPVFSKEQMRALARQRGLLRS